MGVSVEVPGAAPYVASHGASHGASYGALHGASHVVCTMPHLTDYIRWAEVQGVPVGGNVISVRHEGRRMTTLRNESGPPLTWKALFPSPGRCALDGKSVETVEVLLHGTRAFGATITVGSGEAATVRLDG